MNTAGLTPYTAASNALGQFWSAVPDPRVLLFALGISIVTAVLFGLAPAFTGTRVSLADTLREDDGAVHQQHGREGVEGHLQSARHPGEDLTRDGRVVVPPLDDTHHA